MSTQTVTSRSIPSLLHGLTTPFKTCDQYEKTQQAGLSDSWGLMRNLWVRRNTQYLARINLVGMQQHGLVGFKDTGVLIKCAAKLFADFRQVVAANHGAPLRFCFWG